MNLISSRLISSLRPALAFAPQQAKTKNFTKLYSKKPDYRVSWDEVDIVERPSDEYWNSFMKWIVKKRHNFKLADHYIWKDCFKDDYMMVFICKKGTTDVMACTKFMWQRALPSHKNIDFIHLGFFYVADEYRGKDILKIMDTVDTSRSNLAANSAAQVTGKTSLSFWKKAFKRVNIGFDVYLTLYDGENVRIPSPPLKFDDIIVKSAHQVPDDDITKYDQSIYPFERTKYTLTNLRDPDGFGQVAYDRNGNVIGFGTTTVYPTGYCTLYPFYADNEKVVQAMFQQCLIDIEKSGRKITQFEARVPETEGFDNWTWMKPFLTHEPRRELTAQFLYNYEMPKGFNLKKVYVCSHPSVSSI